MIGIGNTVRIRPCGRSVFTVVGEDEDDDARVLIESVESAPGRYPFSMRRSDLMRHDAP